MNNKTTMNNKIKGHYCEQQAFITSKAKGWPQSINVLGDEGYRIFAKVPQVLLKTKGQGMLETDEDREFLRAFGAFIQFDLPSLIEQFQRSIEQQALVRGLDRDDIADWFEEVLMERTGELLLASAAYGDLEHCIEVQALQEATVDTVQINLTEEAVDLALK